MGSDFIVSAGTGTGQNEFQRTRRVYIPVIEKQFVRDGRKGRVGWTDREGGERGEKVPV